MANSIKAVFFLHFVTKALSSSNLVVTVDLRAEGRSSDCTVRDDDAVNCKDLDSAIGYATSLEPGNSSLAITLPDGVHYITTQINFGDANVNFVGLGHNVTVVCEYYADNETFDSARIHTWFFNKSRSVGMENIHFRNCGFPFRLTFIQQVNINNCTFM